MVENEVAIMKKLDHPNLVRLVEILDDNQYDKLFLVMEYVKNGSLANKLQKT
jgi:serine/threonine protein kinase